eukprot:3330701-Amphidinium_carterae.1
MVPQPTTRAQNSVSLFHQVPCSCYGVAPLLRVPSCLPPAAQILISWGWNIPNRIPATTHLPRPAPRLTRWPPLMDLHEKLSIPLTSMVPYGETAEELVVARLSEISNLQ